MTIRGNIKKQADIVSRGKSKSAFNRRQLKLTAVFCLKLDKINPTCPGCGEEHLYWQVGLTDEEQAILDTHTEEHKGESSIVSLMSPPGLIITRRLKCGLCGTEFEARCAIYKEDEVGYTHPDMIPGCQMGEKPVF